MNAATETLSILDMIINAQATKDAADLAAVEAAFKAPCSANTLARLAGLPIGETIEAARRSTKLHWWASTNLVTAC